LEVLEATGWLQHFPEISALRNCAQEPEWHPEGDAFTTHAVVPGCLGRPARLGWIKPCTRRILMFAVLAHDFGKPATTRQEIKRDRLRWISPGHEAAGGPIALAFLRRIGAPLELDAPVSALVVNHLAHHHGQEHFTDTSVRRLARRLAPATIQESGDRHAGGQQRPSSPHLAGDPRPDRGLCAHALECAHLRLGLKSAVPCWMRPFRRSSTAFRRAARLLQSHLQAIRHQRSAHPTRPTAIHHRRRLKCRTTRPSRPCLWMRCLSSLAQLKIVPALHRGCARRHPSKAGRTFDSLIKRVARHQAMLQREGMQALLFRSGWHQVIQRSGKDFPRIPNRSFGTPTEVMGASFRKGGNSGTRRLRSADHRPRPARRIEGLIGVVLDPPGRPRRIAQGPLMKRPSFALNEDAMATEKTAEGIRLFSADIVKLEQLILQKRG
jgi:hypothetical protein